MARRSRRGGPKPNVVGHEPRGRTELDARGQAAEPRAHTFELLAVGALRGEPRRVLEQHRTELSRAIQWLECVDEPRPHLIERVVVEMVRVEVPLLGGLGRK